jgi:hypothetical protein
VASFREDADGTFKLVPSPTLNPTKLSALYDIAQGRLTPQDFLNLHYRQLQRIAVGGNTDKKMWLRDFLTQCKEIQPLRCSDTKGILSRK